MKKWMEEEDNVDRLSKEIKTSSLKKILQHTTEVAELTEDLYLANTIGTRLHLPSGTWIHKPSQITRIHFLKQQINGLHTQ